MEQITAHCTHVIIAGTPLLARAFEPTDHFRLNAGVCVGFLADSLVCVLSCTQ